MGHRIAAHNYSHRDLGGLSSAEDLRYEIDEAIEAVERMLAGVACADFAIGFGQPHNVSPEAAEWLQRRCPRVYACSRGLNVVGITPRFALRDGLSFADPMICLRACLDGATDARWSRRHDALRSMSGVLGGGAADG